ncbi:MAG: LysR family transcriptional regulator [Beijerinckiaceae bacterium]|jgi:DNA-binding transcriptional LysR family regulator|nr:LysR family transcriptional regulator [Beijerinckiaceae bacterium]MDO9441656.1 LysR family transcriptional regulator [Beijerinckiaceae bacterium]
MENLEDMAVFVRVVARGSFTAAGRELNKTTSAISKHVARLEAALSAKLLNRSTHHLALTESGARFHDRCVRILAELEEARADLSAASPEMSGLLRVQASPGVGQSIVAPAAIEIGRRHPKLMVELSVGDFTTTIMRRGMDVLIGSRAFTSGEDSSVSLMAQDLGPAPYVICASPAYLARAGAPAQPEDLARHPCLVHATQKKDPQAWQFARGAARFTVRANAKFRSSLEHAVLLAALEGLGIARLPLYSVSDQLARGDLVSLFPDAVVSDRIIKAFTPRSDILPGKVKVLIEEVQARLGGAAALSRKAEPAFVTLMEEPG